VAQLALDQGQDQGALVGEIAVHQPLADLGLGGDIADGTGMETAGDEALLGGVEDAPALGLGMGGGGRQRVGLGRISASLREVRASRGGIVRHKV
jgi:hypothetical protein